MAKKMSRLTLMDRIGSPMLFTIDYDWSLRLFFICFRFSTMWANITRFFPVWSGFKANIRLRFNPEEKHTSFMPKIHLSLQTNLKFWILQRAWIFCKWCQCKAHYFYVIMKSRLLSSTNLLRTTPLHRTFFVSIYLKIRGNGV